MWYSKMKIWQVLSSMVMAVILSACASTQENFSYSEIKRPLTSDFELAMSLLNRPLPEDQLFMLAFAKQQTEQWGYMNYVSILGNKSDSPAPTHANWLTTALDNDINAKFIKAEKL